MKNVKMTKRWQKQTKLFEMFHQFCRQKKPHKSQDRTSVSISSNVQSVPSIQRAICLLGKEPTNSCNFHNPLTKLSPNPR